jgi:hypothetical protein
MVREMCNPCQSIYHPVLPVLSDGPYRFQHVDVADPKLE